MRKIMIFAAFAALLSLSSCSKVEPKSSAAEPASVSGSPVFTAGINPGTKTTVEAQYGTVSWEMTDEITITDAAKQSAVYGISKIDESTGYATFEFRSGVTLGSGPYSAFYGEEPAISQTYSATPGKLYMKAPETETTSLTFTVQCALMEINLTKEGELVKKIEVTGKPDGKEETTYTLTCTEPVSIAEKKSFYIALPAGTYTRIVITDSEDKVCTLNVKAEGIPVTVNQIVPATFDAEHLNFPQPTTGTAKAIIGGSEVDVNWVQLWADGPKFAEYNVGASSATDAGTKMTFTEATKKGEGYVWGANWCTPNKDYMEHLMTAATGRIGEKVTCVYIQENYVYGFKFTGSTDGYTDNSVFFPAQEGADFIGIADYWSSTPSSGDQAYSMNLQYSFGDWYSGWYSRAQDGCYFVRPVLRN